jgi:hypothetical protein
LQRAFVGRANSIVHALHIHNHPAMSKAFSTPPSSASIKLHPFIAHHPQADIDRLKRKLDDVEEIRTTYENSYAPEELHFGVRKNWVEAMLYDWRAFDW